MPVVKYGGGSIIIWSLVHCLMAWTTKVGEYINESIDKYALTLSADCDVPKKMGMKASQMIQVVYIVNPMGLASLKVSGTPRVLMA